MNPGPANKNGRIPLWAGILAALFFLGSCDSEPPPMCPRTGVGVLEGYLKVLGEGVSARITARAQEGADPGASVATTESDSTGWYRLELPTGLYQLQVSPSGFGSSSSELYDTIRVLPRIFRFDLKRSRAEVRIGMPADMEGARFSLWLRSENERSVNESSKVEDGLLVFEYPVLVPADYTMELDGEYLVDEFFLPGGPEGPDGDLLKVDLDRAAVYEADYTDSYVSLSGSITGSWQARGPGGQPPAVELFSPDSTWVGRTSCRSDGTFDCGLMWPQPVVLSSEISDVRQWFGGDSFATARVFDLEAGDRISGLDEVESGIRVQLDGPGELVVHRPIFTIVTASGEELQPNLYWNDPFTISNLRPGVHYLYLEGYCHDQVWVSQWYGGSEAPEGAAAIDLAAGELRTIEMDLVQGGRIEGNLLRADGTRPRNIMYGLFDAAGQPVCSNWFQWRQFDEGRFRFRGLAEGEYYLGAQVSGDEVWWYPGTGEFSAADPLTIENGAELFGIDWMLP